MTMEDACNKATAFLQKHLEENEWFTPEDDLDDEDAEGTELWVLQHDHCIIKDGGILAMFTHGHMVDLDSHDPTACAQRCMDALKAAHPEVFEFNISHVVWEDDA
jgi:hypothetical protein